MPVFAFTAGSLGDILALIGVVRGLSSSLSDIYTQSGALRELVDDVALFSRAIDQIKKTLDRRDGAMHEDVLRGIREHLTICRDILLVVTGRITAFNGKMSKRGGLTMDAIRMYWAVAAWEILGGHEEVDRLRARLRDQISAIQIYMSLAQSQNQEAVLATALRQHAGADRIVNSAQDVQRCFGRPAVPSFSFFCEETGLPYGPCARTSVEHAKWLFGDMTFRPRTRTPGLLIRQDIRRLLDHSRDEEHLGLAGAGWGFDIQFLFYRGVFGCFEAFIAIPPHATTSPTAMQSLCRDLVMVGHLDLNRRGTDIASYREIKARGDFMNRVVQVYDEFMFEYRKVLSTSERISSYLWDSHPELELDQTFETFLQSFPDPEFLETTVLPRFRTVPKPRNTYTEDWDAPLPFIPETPIDEVLSTLTDCPRLDPAMVAQYKLAERTKIVVCLRDVMFSDAALELVRAAAHVPDFWKGL